MYTMLPMVGYIQNIAELSFEKTPQSETILERSNNRGVQLFTMRKL